MILTLTILVTSCDDLCIKEPNQKTREKVFNNCLSELAKARSSISYTTNDDEDLDEAIAECATAAYYISLTKEHCEK